jgi:hypothetical protein
MFQPKLPDSFSEFKFKCQQLSPEGMAEGRPMVGEREAMGKTILSLDLVQVIVTYVSTKTT